MPNLPEELVHSYKSVVEDFIQERAPNEINIGARLRREVLERIATGTFSIDVLDRVRDEVLSLLADNVWLKFVEAEEKTAAGREQKGDGGGAGA
ncbi:hypothetical protein M427DRAFT_52013 [Gonapodya prolifera JEL478]|uniref:RGS domain-containing protein n=1 Tax=Gonapodya prolifera (strain JEL478) TaxID=1344416 RepID=A0A139AUH9_GONPJ|nr:hypothetical protein M427DRAFT_52013 [Gonapodya prolifera JEL478]|eukprot:KXS20367.1 hypothetical protein M427DRAFT_52013 [Gonapodya prolifera JEL478]